MNTSTVCLSIVSTFFKRIKMDIISVSIPSTRVPELVIVVSTAVCQTGSEIGLDCSRGSCVSFQEASAVTPPTPGVTPAVALVGSDCVDGAVDDLAQTPDVIQARICAPRMRSIALLLLALLALLMVSAMRHNVMISDTPASAVALSNTKHDETSTPSMQFSSHARRAHPNERLPPPSAATISSIGIAEA